MCPCTRVDVLQRDEKNTLCLKEALTRAPKTIVAPRDAANFLSSAANYWASSRDFVGGFFSMQEMPVECGLLARVGAASRRGEKRFSTRESVARASKSCRHGPERAQKFFLYNVAKSAVDRPRRVESSKSVVPIRCTMPSAPTGRSKSPKMRVASSATSLSGVDPRLDHAVRRDATRASINARAWSGGVRRSGRNSAPCFANRALSDIEARFGALAPHRGAPLTRHARVWTTCEAERDAMPRSMKSQIPSLRLQQIVDGLRVGLAAGRLHHLADEPADHRGLRLGLRRLVGIGGDDLVDDAARSRPTSVTCFRPRASTIATRIAAFGPHDLEQILGDLARDGARRAIRSRMRAELRGRDGRGGDAPCLPG